MKKPKLLTTVACLTALAFLALPSASRAAVLTLAGFEAYPTGSSGAKDTSSYLFDDDSSTGWTNTTVKEGTTSQSNAIALPLSLGTNEFSFSDASGYATSNGSYAGISLFFTSDGTSVNPAGSLSGGTPPELSAYTTYPGTGVSTPASGVDVPDYASPTSPNTVVVLDPYSGATSYSLDGYNVAVTGLTTSGTGGTFELTVTSATTPEPSSVALVAVGLGAVALIVGRRAAKRA